MAMGRRDIAEEHVRQRVKANGVKGGVENTGQIGVITTVSNDTGYWQRWAGVLRGRDCLGSMRGGDGRRREAMERRPRKRAEERKLHGFIFVSTARRCPEERFVVMTTARGPRPCEAWRELLPRIRWWAEVGSVVGAVSGLSGS